MKTQPLSTIGTLQFPAFASPMAAQQLAMQYMLGQSQHWPLGVMRDHQCAQLGLLLRHAAQTVPYYRELFARHGIVIPGNIGHDFLATLPISTRQDLQSAGGMIRSLGVPKEHGQVSFSTTSGSTGEPLTFGKAMISQLLWFAFNLRDHLWHGGTFGKKFGVIRWLPPGKADPPLGSRTPNWGEGFASIFRTGELVMLNVKARLPEQMEWLRRERPDYLLSLPSNLAALADHAEKNGQELPKVEVLRTYGEMLPPELRRRLESAWQTKVIDMYTCEESGYLALQCPEHGHYHVQSENVWLEIVDDSGRPCPPGRPGRVLITNLNNFVTPLIRYDIGDVAEFGEPCPCGRGLPVLSRIHGRKRNRFILPNGESISPIIGERIVVSLIPGLQISRFRCIQHTTSQVELQLVANRVATAEEQAKIIDVVRENLGHPFEITITFPAEIPGGPTGKFETFISQVRV